MSKNKDKSRAIRRRNPVATNPLLRKAGPHGPTKKAKRRRDQIALERGDHDE